MPEKIVAALDPEPGSIIAAHLPRPFPMLGKARSVVSTEEGFSFRASSESLWLMHPDLERDYVFPLALVVLETTK